MKYLVKELNEERRAGVEAEYDVEYLVKARDEERIAKERAEYDAE